MSELTAERRAELRRVVTEWQLDLPFMGVVTDPRWGIKAKGEGWLCTFDSVTVDLVEFIETACNALPALLDAVDAAEKRAEKCENTDNEIIVHLQQACSLESERAAAAEAEAAALRARVERLKAAMGAEWIELKKNPPLHTLYYCRECSEYREDGHTDKCARGAFFAALAGEG